MASQDPPRALQRKPAAENLKLWSGDGEIDNVKDTPTPDVFKVPQTPTRKQKRPNTRDPPTPTIPRSFDTPLPQTPNTAWVRRGSTYVRNPDIDIFYSDHQRVAFPPTWYHQGEDVHGFPPYDTTTGGHGRYDYGGRQYLRPEVAEPRSPCRFKSLSDHPSPRERQGAILSLKRARYVPAFADDAGLPVWKDRTSAVQVDHSLPPTRPTSLLANSMLESDPISSRELEHVLPRVSKGMKSRPSKSQNHRPPDRQITLALRPASSVKSLRDRDRESFPTPSPALKRRRTGAALSTQLEHANLNSGGAPPTSISSRPQDTSEVDVAMIEPMERKVTSLNERLIRSEKTVREVTSEPTPMGIQMLLTKERASQDLEWRKEDDAWPLLTP